MGRCLKDSPIRKVLEGNGIFSGHIIFLLMAVGIGRPLECAVGIVKDGSFVIPRIM